MPSPLRDRLQRLKHAERASSTVEPSASDDLSRLEQSLVGEVRDELPLKARLERLVAVAGRGRGARDREPVGRDAAPIEEVVQGCRVENERGEFFRIEDSVPLESMHGEIPLSRFRVIEPNSVGIVAGEPGFEAFDLERAVYLDTETTGLSGGTGTAAFLIGIGYVDGERFYVRQYFMRDYHEEAALLRGLAEDLAGFAHIVTYNGKMFDVPLLETRYRLNRDRFPLAGAPHLDLLHPARRLWKARFDSCRLQNLEVALLGVRRHGDVPGELIPQLYFDYVRRRDARAMAKVFQHNRIDVISLAALALLACQWVQGGWADDPRDVYSLARVLERARLHERSEAAYQRAIESAASPVRLDAIRRLATRTKRNGDHARAAELWAEAADAGDLQALRELAVHHEHRQRDLQAALAVVERGLSQAAARSDPRALRARRDFEHRRARLLAKCAARR